MHLYYECHILVFNLEVSSLKIKDSSIIGDIAFIIYENWLSLVRRLMQHHHHQLYLPSYNNICPINFEVDFMWVFIN